MRKIAVLSGDGIGPEVCAEAVKVLDTIAKLFDHQFEYKYGLCGGAAYEKYGEHLPQESLEIMSSSDAILFGSVGGPVEAQNEPKWKNAEKNCILGMRKALGLAINVRPAKIFKSLHSLSPLKESILSNGIDLVIIRELISGIYFGEHTTASDGRSATDIMKYTIEEIEVCIRYGFKLAEKRRQKLCVVDKANVLDTSRLWRKVAKDIAVEYPTVELQFMYVDNAMIQLISKPSTFDVIVTENMFGDILSDAASILPGSLGLMPSISCGNNPNLPALYEPIGGSAPDIAEQNKANPIAQILCAALMLRHSFEMEKEAVLVEKAVEQTLAKGIKTFDLLSPEEKLQAKSGSENTAVGTNTMGDEIVRTIIELAKGCSMP